MDVDALDGVTVVLDGVTSDDDENLRWCRRAPCVVVGRVPAGSEPPAAPDLVVVGDDAEDELAVIVGSIRSNPSASRVLADVLRAVPDVDVPAALTVESLAYSTLLAGPEFAQWLDREPRRQLRSPEGPAVRMHQDGDVLGIALARPENRNAFSAAMRDALHEALTVAVVDTTIERVVVSGDGPVFSSGGDLTEFGTAPNVVRAHEVRTQRSVGAVIAELGGRATVRVHGSCVGAGVELPAFAHHVVAAPGTTFRLPEVGMGLIPGAGGTVSVTRRIGPQETARLAILGETIDADRALALGLIDEIS